MELTLESSNTTFTDVKHRHAQISESGTKRLNLIRQPGGERAVMVTQEKNYRHFQYIF